MLIESDSNANALDGGLEAEALIRQHEVSGYRTSRGNRPIIVPVLRRVRQDCFRGDSQSTRTPNDKPVTARVMEMDFERNVARAHLLQEPLGNLG